MLKPGGLIVFSFLEFYVLSHWAIFAQDVDHGGPGDHLNQFIERNAISCWVANVGLKFDAVFAGDTPHIPLTEPLTWHDGREMREFGALGKSAAVLSKP